MKVGAIPFGAIISTSRDHSDANLEPGLIQNRLHVRLHMSSIIQSRFNPFIKCEKWSVWDSRSPNTLHQTIRSCFNSYISWSTPGERSVDAQYTYLHRHYFEWSASSVSSLDNKISFGGSCLRIAEVPTDAARREALIFMRIFQAKCEM